MQQGEALALQKLLTKRFGSIPVQLQLKISGATAAQIDIWLDSVFEVTRRLLSFFGIKAPPIFGVMAPL